jgi:hypothetical protein
MLVAQSSTGANPSVTLSQGASVGTTTTLPLDSVGLLAAIRSSYYHPDNLAGMDCYASVDWQKFFAAMKIDAPADRMKAIQDIRIRVHSERDKKPELSFEWPAGPLDNAAKTQMEDGLKQMVAGYFQMYWAMVAGSLVSDDDTIDKIEPQPDGGVKASSSKGSVSSAILVGSNGAAKHITVDTGAMKVDINVHYTDSPNPVPGDLRRITEVEVNDQMGTSSMKVNVGLDYQPVDGFQLPKHVDFGVEGAFSIGMDLAGCTVMQKNKVTTP